MSNKISKKDEESKIERGMRLLIEHSVYGVTGQCSSNVIKNMDKSSIITNIDSAK